MHAMILNLYNKNIRKSYFTYLDIGTFICKTFVFDISFNKTNIENNF